jgi:hypothetical protein
MVGTSATSPGAYQGFERFFCGVGGLICWRSEGGLLGLWGDSVSESDAVCSRLLDDVSITSGESACAHRDMLILLPFSCSVMSTKRLGALGILIDTVLVKAFLGKLKNGEVSSWYP